MGLWWTSRISHTPKIRLKMLNTSVFYRYAFRNEMKLLFLVVHTDLGFRTTAAISMETARRVPRKKPVEMASLPLLWAERSEKEDKTRCRNNKQCEVYRFDPHVAHPIVWLHQSWFFRVLLMYRSCCLNFCNSTWMFLVINKYKQNSVPVNVLTPFSMINKKPSDLVKTPYPFIHSTSFNLFPVSTSL